MVTGFWVESACCRIPEIFLWATAANATWGAANGAGRSTLLHRVFLLINAADAANGRKINKLRSPLYSISQAEPLHLLL